MTNPVPRQILCTHRGRRVGTPDGHQASGLHQWRSAIESKAECRLVMLEAKEPSAIHAAVKDQRPDVLLLFPDWRWPAETAITLCRDLQTQGVRIAFVDYYATANSPHFGVLPYVDVYVKRQVLRDRSLYQRALAGGTPFTEFVHNNLSIECADWGFRSALDVDQSYKIVVGWNLGVLQRYHRMARVSRRLGFAWSFRPYELNARFGVVPLNASGDWYEKYRAFCFDAVERLPRRPRMPGFGRVGRRRYFTELLMSRTVLSPFGWGEVCFRDYEAVASGCLLLKPTMDHLETAPDIYKAGETYVPLRWDLADLEEKLEWIRAHPGESRQIVERAQRVLCDYFEQNQFVDMVVSVLARVPRF